MMKREDWSLYLDAAARALGLEIDAEMRPAVLDNLQTAEKMAALLNEAGQSDHDELAPVYEA